MKVIFIINNIAQLKVVINIKEKTLIFITTAQAKLEEFINNLKNKRKKFTHQS